MDSLLLVAVLVHKLKSIETNCTSRGENHENTFSFEYLLDCLVLLCAAVGRSRAALGQNPSMNMIGAGKSPSHGVHMNGLSSSPNPYLRASLAKDPREASPREASLAQSRNQNLNMVGARKSPGHGVHQNNLIKPLCKSDKGSKSKGSKSGP